MRWDLVTAAELTLMSPAEQDAVFEQNVVRDPDADDRVRPEFLARVRARVQARLDSEDAASWS
jgi:hypothetical protein